MLSFIYSQSYLFMAVLALVFGLFFPQARALMAINTLLLQIIFFLSCLKIEPRALFTHLKDWRLLAMSNALMLIGFPAAVWLIGLPSHSEFGFALFLLAAMPVGMTAPLLVEVAGGKQSIAMVLTVTTSLLAPITVPLMTKALYGAQIAVDASSMFKQLALIIFVPFILAMVAKALLPKTVATLGKKTKIISVILLGLLIAGAVAKQSTPILSESTHFWTFVGTLILLYGFFLALHFAGYFSFWWEPKDIKQASSITLTYMNFTLAIFLASEFFPEPGIIIPLVLAIIPWATFMPIWQKISKKL